MEEELFLKHYNLKQEYKSAKIEYDKALAKKAEYYYSILPGSTKFEQELIKGRIADKLLNYTIKSTEIDKEIEVRRNLMDNLSYRVKLLELELNDSDRVLDQVYNYKYVKNMKVRVICLKTHYSKTQVYRQLEEIEKKLKMGQNGKKVAI